MQMRKSSAYSPRPVHALASIVMRSVTEYALHGPQDAADDDGGYQEVEDDLGGRHQSISRHAVLTTISSAL